MRLMLRETAAPVLALFASVSTLLCCALPALLITVGAGAVMAGLAANVPGLVWLTAHKGLLFIGAGVLLLAAINHEMGDAKCALSDRSGAGPGV